MKQTFLVRIKLTFDYDYPVTSVLINRDLRELLKSLQDCEVGLIDITYKLPPKKGTAS
jgi:hypothetical protein